ncbi:ionotropic receptor 75a-like isoform X1 [Lucilia cuprina]|uniref:ionotropic receptor 75a-like isoform X1 n=1 Tax=Lucilia cuprina TaxID=7375 RepID=UPI001F06F262|nr:ionotropic receptor 75a-like isoform X1 [Lucilia cuprina]
MQLLIIAIALLFYVNKSVEGNCNNNKSNDKWLTSAKGSKKDSVKSITLAYFQYHGVRSLNLIVCPANSTGIKGSKRRFPIVNKVIKISALEISSMVLFYMEHNLPVRVWSGEDYLPEMPKREVFGPPITFREVKNDSYRRPLKLKLEPIAHKTGVMIIDFNTPCALNVLRWSAASENNYFKTNSFWLLITKDIADLKALEDEDIFLPPDSEVKVLVEGINKTFSLLDIYKVAAFKPLKQNMVAENFSKVEVMCKALSSYGSVISLRENLEGIVFNTGLVINFPDMFTDIEDLSLRHIDTMAKVTNRLVVDMARKLNLRFNTYQTDNYGWHKPNGSFSGLMGRFQRYELDFGQMAFFMRLDRTKVCNFLVETFRIRAGIMFRQPPLSSVANIFTMPFDIKVWICLIILIVLTICVFALELALSPYTHEMHYWDCIIFVWGAMCQQGFYGSVSNLSARIIIFTTFVATLFLFISFSANIVALLQSPSEAIRTLNDLSHSSLELGVMDTVYNRVFLNESTDPVTRYLYRKKILPKGESIYMSPAVGINKMRYETFAFQVELQTGYQIISDTFSEPEKCGLKEMEPYKLPMIAVPTRKNFPYKELFRRQLRWQREVGLMNREEMKWFTQRPKCEGLGRFVSIGLKECRYAWAVLGWGCLFALTALGCELLLKKFLK